MCRYKRGYIEYGGEKSVGNRPGWWLTGERETTRARAFIRILEGTRSISGSRRSKLVIGCWRRSLNRRDGSKIIFLRMTSSRFSFTLLDQELSGAHPSTSILLVYESCRPQWTLAASTQARSRNPGTIVANMYATDLHIRHKPH